MTSPAQPPQPTNNIIRFRSLVDDAQVEFAQIRKTAAYALQIGLDPVELIDYARGALPQAARREVESVLSRSHWALGRVVALVRSARNPASLGARILASSDIDPYAWGMKDTGDADMDLCRLLEQIE